MNESKIYVDYLGESIVMRTALIGGWTDEKESKPITMFGGPLDVDDILHSLLYVNRAVFKILTNEFVMKLDESHEVLAKVLQESFTQEILSRIDNQSDVTVKTVVKTIKTKEI